MGGGSGAEPPFPPFAPSRLRQAGTFEESASVTMAMGAAVDVKQKISVTESTDAEKKGQMTLSVESAEKGPIEAKMPGAGFVGGADGEPMEMPAVTLDEYTKSYTYDFGVGRMISTQTYTKSSLGDQFSMGVTIDTKASGYSKIAADVLAQVAGAVEEIRAANAGMMTEGDKSIERLKAVDAKFPKAGVKALCESMAEQVAFIKENMMGGPGGDEEAGAAADVVGKAAPEFTLKDVDGKDVALSSFKGKVVLAKDGLRFDLPAGGLAEGPAVRRLRT